MIDVKFIMSNSSGNRNPRAAVGAANDGRLKEVVIEQLFCLLLLAVVILQGSDAVKARRS